MCKPVKEGSMVLNLNTAVTSRQLHNAFQSADSRERGQILCKYQPTLWAMISLPAKDFGPSYLP